MRGFQKISPYFFDEKGELMIDIEVGRAYSTEEMREFFDETKDSWKKNKAKSLNYLKQFYEYEERKCEHDRRRTEYYIIRKIKPYESLVKSKRERQNRIYSEYIIPVIKQDPLQTAANVSRIIVSEKEIIALNHKESTSYDYVRKNMKEMFGKNSGKRGTLGIIFEKVWCHLDKSNNKYLPLSDKEKSFLFERFSTLKDKSMKQEIEIYQDYKADLISEDEMQRQVKESSIAWFLKARAEFAAKYGYHPMKVPKYEFSAW